MFGNIDPLSKKLPFSLVAISQGRSLSDTDFKLGESQALVSCARSSSLSYMLSTMSLSTSCLLRIGALHLGFMRSLPFWRAKFSCRHGVEKCYDPQSSGL